MRSRIYLSSPHMSRYEQQYVNEAFMTNWIAPLGPNVEAFEQDVANYVGVKSALALNSGTSAIHLALRCLNVSEGDIVFCSSLTFIASSNPIIYQGATPVFIDSEPSSWNMSPIALEKAFSECKRNGKLPKAVIVVNLYGQSADFDSIRNICDSYGVPIVEDAAESLGATYKGKKSGSFGQFGIFSFNGNKIITTSGGGMLISNDDQLIAKARHWATQARDQARHYQHSELGYNYRLSNVLAGIGRGQMKVLEERVNARRKVFEGYYENFGSIDGVNFMPELPYGRSTRWLTAMVLNPEYCKTNVTEIINALDKENIEARPVWKPLHLQPLFKNNLYFTHDDGVSISDYLFENGICLPSGSNLLEEEQNRVIEIIKQLLTSVFSNK